MFFSQKIRCQWLFSMFFWNATIGNNYFHIFPTIAIVGANDDRRRCFAPLSWLKEPKQKRLKRAKKSELLFFAKTSVQSSFSKVFWCFYVFPCFNHRWRLFSMFFLDATTGTTFSDYFRLVGANDDRQRSFAQVIELYSCMAIGPYKFF